MNVISPEEARAMSKDFKKTTTGFIDSIIDEINLNIKVYALVGNRYFEFEYPLNVFPSSRESTVPYAVHREIQNQFVGIGYLVRDIHSEDGTIVGLEITWDEH